MTCDRSGIFPGTPVSSINKTDRHDITEILALSTINQTKKNPLKLMYNVDPNSELKIESKRVMIGILPITIDKNHC